MKYSSKIVIAPKIFSPLPGIIFLLIAFSCLIGVFNPGFWALVRKFLFPAAFFIGNQGGFVHGHMLDSYDNEHIYVRWVDAFTIDMNDGTAGEALRYVIGIT